MNSYYVRPCSCNHVVLEMFVNLYIQLCNTKHSRMKGWFNIQGILHIQCWLQSICLFSVCNSKIVNSATIYHEWYFVQYITLLAILGHREKQHLLSVLLLCLLFYIALKSHGCDLIHFALIALCRIYFILSMIFQHADCIIPE